MIFLNRFSIDIGSNPNIKKSIIDKTAMVSLEKGTPTLVSTNEGKIDDLESQDESWEVLKFLKFMMNMIQIIMIGKLGNPALV